MTKELTNMPTIRVRITDPNFESRLRVSYASAWDDGRGPQKTVAKLNKKAQQMAATIKTRPNNPMKEWLAPTYELATEDAYQAYFRAIKDAHHAENSDNARSDEESKRRGGAW